jgi:hypothetical protein
VSYEALSERLARLWLHDSPVNLRNKVSQSVAALKANEMTAESGRAWVGAPTVLPPDNKSGPVSFHLHLANLGNSPTSGLFVGASIEMGGPQNRAEIERHCEVGLRRRAERPADFCNNAIIPKSDIILNDNAVNIVVSVFYKEGVWFEAKSGRIIESDARIDGCVVYMTRGSSDIHITRFYAPIVVTDVGSLSAPVSYAIDPN